MTIIISISMDVVTLICFEDGTLSCSYVHDYIITIENVSLILNFID